MASKYKPKEEKEVIIATEGGTIRDHVDISESKDNEESILHRMKAGPKKTHIKIVDHNTGEVIDEGHNTILLEGSQVAACKMFGLDQVVVPPTYNSMLELDHTISSDWGTQPYNEPIVCLWCAGRDGFVNTANEVKALNNLELIRPEDMVPFRYQNADDDLPQELRSVYFGRKTTKDNHIAYYFKAFGTQVMLHVRYLDGTEVTPNLYNVDSSQIAEIWTEMRLEVSMNDFRDYFNDVIGWDNADISSISLLTGWYDDTKAENPQASAADKIYYKWYQDVVPFSKWNFRKIDLFDQTKAVDFIYQVYF